MTLRQTISMDLDGLKRDDIVIELMLLNKPLRLTSF